jgi:hypothetical protein
LEAVGDMNEPSIGWLLEPRDPSIRLQAFTDLLDRPANDKDVVATREKIPNYEPVKRIMGTQTGDVDISRKL